MDKQILIVMALTFIINLISTLSYSVRIAGIRTGKIAISLSLFNILVLVSRTSNSFQSPLLAKHIESNIEANSYANAETEFRWLLLTATLATIVGAILIPTFQRLFGRAVLAFSRYRSVPRLLFHSFSKAGIFYIKDSITIPARENITQVKDIRSFPLWTLVFNTIAVSILTVGVFSSLYAGYLNPELRVTSNSLSSIINGIATMLMFVFIDPSLSIMTDDVIEGKVSDSYFRKFVTLLVGTRLLGTIAAQLMLVPAARLIANVANHM
jgi:hypothetical protein